MNPVLFFWAAMIMVSAVVLAVIKAVQIMLSSSGGQEKRISNEGVKAAVASVSLMQTTMKLILFFKNRYEVRKLENAICKTPPLESVDLEREKEKAIYFAIMILLWSTAIAVIMSIPISNIHSFNFEDTQLMFPIYLPEFVESNAILFYLVIGLQYMLCFHVVAINGATLSSFAYASNILCAQNYIIGKGVYNLTNDERDDEVNGNARVISDHGKKEKVKEYVKFHVHLINIVSQLEITFGGIIFWEFLGSQSMSCLLTYQAIKEANVGKILSAIQAVILIPALLMPSFVYFFLGTKISESSEELRTVIYSSYWYEQPLWFKKSLLIIMKRMNKVLTFNSTYVIPVNLNSFLKSLRAGFSYFNFLNAMTGR